MLVPNGPGSRAIRSRSVVSDARCRSGAAAVWARVLFHFYSDPAVIPCRAVADWMPPPTKKHKKGEDDPPSSPRSSRPKLDSRSQQSEARRAIAAAYVADPGASADPAGDHAGVGRRASSGEPTRHVSANDTPAYTQQASGVIWQWASAAELSADTAAAVRAMLRRNMQPHYAAAEWPAEWRRKQRNVLHRDSRRAWRLPLPHSSCAA